MSQPVAEIDTVQNPAPSQPPASPWMSVNRVAAYVGRHRNYVLLALYEYDRTKDGKNPQGLKGHQRKVHASWQIHIDDVDRWIQGLPPARGTRRFR